MKSLSAKFLSLFEHHIDVQQYASSKPLKVVQMLSKKDDSLIMTFDKPTHVNSIALYEGGENITDFQLCAKVEGVDVVIYQQDLIGKFRFCAIDVVTDCITLKIVATRKNKTNSINMLAFDLAPKARVFRKTCYATLNSFDNDATDLALLNYYTHINLIGGINVTEQGDIVFKERKNEITKEAINTETTFQKTVEQIRQTNTDMDIVVTLLVENNDTFHKTIAGTKLIDNITAFVAKYAIDGISFDWEYPKGNKQWKAFDDFIIRLKKAIAPKTLTLAIASWLRYNFSPQALASIDVLEVMTYDNMVRNIDGQHSPFYGDCANAIIHMQSKGFTLEQMNIGLPFYGRTVDGKPFWSSYKDDIGEIGRNNNTVYNTYDGVLDAAPYVVGERYYNSYQMIEDKTAYCVYNGVGGVMVWHLGADLSSDHEFCLSKAIADTATARTCKK